MPIIFQTSRRSTYFEGRETFELCPAGTNPIGHLDPAISKTFFLGQRRWTGDPVGLLL
jgi:hypothetical protein